MSAAAVAGSGPLTLQQFNGASAAEAEAALAACLDIPRWVTEVQLARPFPTLDALRASASASADRISWTEVAGALARHPRIGERAAGSSSDAALSASEQAGVHASDQDQLAAGNRAYEDRFGLIFLICASGLSGSQMLAALRERLTHDEEQERLVVMDELRKIAALRLTKAVSG